MKAREGINKVHSRVRSFLDIKPLYQKIFFSFILAGSAMDIIDNVYPEINDNFQLIIFLVLTALIFLSIDHLYKKQ